MLSPVAYSSRTVNESMAGYTVACNDWVARLIFTRAQSPVLRRDGCVTDWVTRD